MKRRPVKKWAGLTVDELRKRWKRDSVHLYGSIDSTNEAARELADEDAPEGTVVLCREQKAGRGRLGRTWHSPSGKGVYLSVIFRPQKPVIPPLASVLAGLGVVVELDRAFPSLDPKLKWPNDLMAGDRKFGGVLCEACWSDADPRYLVVGVGVNVKPMKDALPKSLRARATWIEAHQEDVELPSVADAVLEGLEARLRSLRASMDVAELDLLDRYDWLKNRRVTVTEADEEKGAVGVCVGIAPDGALLFRPDRGALRRVTSATVEAETA